MRKTLRAAAVTATALITAGAAAITGISGARADDADTPPSIVENFSYPGAAQIEQQYGIKLIKGDGNIVFMGECTDYTGMLVVESSITPTVADRFCFQVTSSTTGYLSLQVPESYFVDGDGTHNILATVRTDDGRTLKTNVDPDGFTPVGESTGDDNVGALVELRVGWDPSLPQP